ncbi:MAG: MarR family transcriptional regulator [Rubrivivax sp.]|nr:MarR family transcriptional regulator [Rubrivivax sp.]
MSRSRDFKLVHVLGESGIGREARAQASDHGAVRLWLRLLACSTQIEQEVRSRLRRNFATTLPRFDYLAQLERHPDGLRMNALSRYLMVTGGNVTGLTDQLVAEGHVERGPDLLDRRSSIVRLTASGRRHFLRMAEEHERWLIELLEGFDPAYKDTLYELLGRLRVHLAREEVDRRDHPAAAGPRSRKPRTPQKEDA